MRHDRGTLSGHRAGALVRTHLSLHMERKPVAQTLAPHGRAVVAFAEYALSMWEGGLYG